MESSDFVPVLELTNHSKCIHYLVHILYVYLPLNTNKHMRLLTRVYSTDFR